MGQVICAQRKKLGLTQKQLAEKLNITDKAVSKWERDVARPDISIVPKLAEILEITVEELMGVPSDKEVREEIVDFETTSPEVDYLDEGDWYERLLYREKVKKLLIQGAIAFVAGFIFTLCVTEKTEEHRFWFATVIAFVFSGIPYGWQKAGQLLGNWIVIGDFPIVIIAFMLRLCISMVFLYAYPFVLVFNIMKAQKRGGMARKVWKGLFIAMLSVVIALFVVVAVVAILNS